MTQCLPRYDYLQSQKKLLDNLVLSFKNDMAFQSYLIVGPEYVHPLNFIKKLLISIICTNDKSSCGKCKNCRLLAQLSHPDVVYITNQEETGGAIKIDYIRDLQLNIYKTASLTDKKFIIIHPADKLNLAAANALLKILEEPPEHAVFFLLANQIDNLPPTIISRCHKYFMQEPAYLDNSQQDNYFTIAKYYAETDEKYSLNLNKIMIVNQVLNLVSGKADVCSIAQELLTNYKLENLIWFFYLLTAQTIKYRMLGIRFSSHSDESFIEFANTQNIICLYQQMGRLHKLIKKYQENITLNATYALENLLLGYIC